ncbi:hypothetical protein ACIRBX_32510 [Kitasatospora sp. NPDC096147]|uniref:hypothetical protein n=1 Tax=Kitasatospora sp. NPDC096147 TaxID=3364093 RepID=UPI0038309CF2
MIYRVNMVLAVFGVVFGSLLMTGALLGQRAGYSWKWTALAGGVLALTVLELVMQLRQWRRRQRAGGGAKA